MTEDSARSLSAADVEAWADVVDDHNPLHVDPAFAATTRFGHPVVHGSLLFSLVCDGVQAAAPSGWPTSGGLTVRFRAPVPVGAQVRLHTAADRVRLLSAGVEPVEVVVTLPPLP